MEKPPQETIDKLIAYFDTNGTELTPEEGAKLELDGTVKDRGEWSIDVLILTKGGVCEAYYRHENKAFTANNFWPNPFLKHVSMLSDKFLPNTEDTNKQIKSIIWKI